MRGNDLVSVSVLIEVAECQSYTEAARQLGTSRSFVTDSIRALEKKLGVRLLNRTTRSVSLTGPGERLVRAARPAMGQMESASDQLSTHRPDPEGTLRLHLSTISASMVVKPLLQTFQTHFPRMTIEAKIGGTTKGCDARIQVAWTSDGVVPGIKISAPTRNLTLASPDYLARFKPPGHPRDLRSHNCIRFRVTDLPPIPWAYSKDEQTLTLQPTGQLITDDLGLVIEAARQGVGLAYLLESYVSPLIENGQLLPVLEDWSPPNSQYYLTYESHRKPSFSLKIFLDLLRQLGIASTIGDTQAF